MNLETLLLVIPALGIIALLFTWWKTQEINATPEGSPRMAKIAASIQEGAMAFLKAEYRILVIFVAGVAALLYWSGSNNENSHALVAVSFAVGAFCSALAGYLGMKIATKANVRTANAAKDSLGKALEVAFSGGAVMGLGVVGLGILGLGGLFYLFGNHFGAFEPQASLGVTLSVLTGFSFGASSIALFARVGGGIYTKAADVGADLVGKVEAGIPEDHPLNPAITLGADTSITSIPAVSLNAANKASAVKAADPIAKPFTMAAVVLPTASSLSVRFLTSGGSSAISAIPPALSDIGP